MNAPTPRDDDRLRALLEDAVSDVEPRDRLAAIRARTASAPRRRPWLLVAAGAVAATAATVTAVTVLGDGGTSQEPGFAGPSTSSAPSAGPSAGPSTGPSARPSAGPSAGPTTQVPSSGTSTGPASREQAVPVYYVSDTARGPRLYREFHRLDAGGDVLGAAVREAVAARADDPDYRTGWPAGTAVDASFDGVGDDGQISVELFNDSTDLSQRPAGMTPEEASIAVEQLIYTAQAATQTRAPVQFLLARQGSSENRTNTLLGVPVSEPVAQGDAADVLAQVWITNPDEGAEVAAPFEVSGLAAAFEATVLWQVWDVSGEDRQVDSGYTTAEECCTMAPYSFTLDLPPGTYQLVVMDQDMETGEPSYVDSKTVTVLP